MAAAVPPEMVLLKTMELPVEVNPASGQIRAVFNLLALMVPSAIVHL
jgi:hypothetical protein